jgi:hypothetical protein
MARRSVAVLNSAGIKIGYTALKAAKDQVDPPADDEGVSLPRTAIWESERCIRLLPSSDPVQWRRKMSGGTVVWQAERRLSLNERL